MFDLVLWPYPRGGYPFSIPNDTLVHFLHSKPKRLPCFLESLLQLTPYDPKLHAQYPKLLPLVAQRLIPKGLAPRAMT